MPEHKIERKAPDPVTGTVRLDLWSGPPMTAGDDAVGTAWSSRYVSDDGYGCADIEFYVVLYTDEDGEPRDDRPYGVDYVSTIGRAEHDEDGDPRPDDSADVDYDYGSALGFQTEEEAQEECDRLGKQDLSYALYLRKREES